MDNKCKLTPPEKVNVADVVAEAIRIKSWKQPTPTLTYITDLEHSHATLLTAVKQLRESEAYWKDERNMWKMDSEKLKAELEQGRKESIEHQLELLARDTDILLLKKRVAELEGLLKESYQALIDHCSWLGEDALPPRINKALSRKDGE